MHFGLTVPHAGGRTPAHCLRFANPAEAVRCPDAGRLGAWRIGGIYAGHAVYAADKWVSGHPKSCPERGLWRDPRRDGPTGMVEVAILVALAG